MTTVSDYIASMDEDDLSFRRMTNHLLTGDVGIAVRQMVDEAEKDEPFEVIDFDKLMRNVKKPH